MVNYKITKRALVKAKFDILLAERRIGKNLKGMNKDLLQEIENSIWVTLEREVALYQLEHMYQKQRGELEDELKRRKQEIEGEIRRLGEIESEKE